MHTFTFRAVGDPEVGDPDSEWEAVGQGATLPETYKALLSALAKRCGADVFSSSASDLTEHVLLAIGQPGIVACRRCFSTPEDNYNLTYTQPKTKTKTFNIHHAVHKGDLLVTKNGKDFGQTPIGYNANGVCFMDASYDVAEALGEDEYNIWQGDVIDMLREGAAEGISHGLYWRYEEYDEDRARQPLAVGAQVLTDRGNGIVRSVNSTGYWVRIGESSLHFDFDKVTEKI